MNLTKHINIVHKGMKQYNCHLCNDRSYSTKVGMQKHIKQKHQGLEFEFVLEKQEKNHPCPNCHSSFQSSSLLKRHISCVHEGVRKYECEFCGKTYKQSNKLAYHIKTFHQGIKDYSCDFCDKSYAAIENLKLHQKSIHEGMYFHIFCKYYKVISGQIFFMKLNF